MIATTRAWPSVAASRINQSNKRQLWHYLNIIFNRKDEGRWKRFGPDRTCTEWILRNGGAVKLTCCREYLRDYNLIPPEGATITLTAVDATGSSIMHYGFDHFIGCKQLGEINLNKCNFVYDEALKDLIPIGNQLQILKVMECPNVTDEGLMHLKQMKALKSLTIRNLSATNNLVKTAQELKTALPQCAIIT